MSCEEIWLASNDLLETNITAVKTNFIFRTTERSSHWLYFCTPVDTTRLQQVVLIQWSRRWPWLHQMSYTRKPKVVNLGKGQVGKGGNRKRREIREHGGKKEQLEWIPYTWNCQRTNLIKTKESTIIHRGHTLLWCVSREISI